MANLKYWLWLTTRQNHQAEDSFHLLQTFATPEAAYFADPAEYELAGLPPQKRGVMLDKSLRGADWILGECDRLGIRILTYQDAEYPDRLRQIDCPPCVLYVKGRNFAFDEELGIGVVGSRKPTPYGVKMAGKLGLDLARHGALVISGIAQGLDAAALKGALQGGGPVVSVLGGGIDVLYPWENRSLFADVAAAGALISEYPPGAPCEGWHYPIRNRIISGLSWGVVAVEAGLHSGTLITARLALDQSREVFAFPGPADAPMSAGTNRLIQSSQAKLILSAQDVLEEFQDIFPDRLLRPEALAPADTEARLSAVEGERRAARQRQEGQARSRPEAPASQPQSGAALAEPAGKVVDSGPERAYITLKEYTGAFTDDERALLLALEKRSLRPDDLVEETQIPARRVLSALTLLQVRGYVAEKPGKQFVSTVRLGLV